MKTTQTKIEELRDIIALDKYGKTYKALPDDGPEQDYVAGEADARAVHQDCESKTKPGHTPGPWCLDIPCSSELTCRNIRGKNGEHVAKVGWMDFSEGQEIDLANARLIAAAPELLAALEDSADAIDAVIVNIEGGAKDALREINRRNRAAIAAAKGCQ